MAEENTQGVASKSHSLHRLVRPGDQFTKNGVRLTVHFVDHGQVYWVAYKVGETGWDEKRGCPAGYLGNHRCPKRKFIEKTADANFKPAGSNGEVSHGEREGA